MTRLTILILATSGQNRKWSHPEHLKSSGMKVVHADIEQNIFVLAKATWRGYRVRKYHQVNRNSMKMLNTSPNILCETI